MRRALFIAAAVATAAAPALGHAQSVGRVELTMFGGAGATQSLSQPGLDRSAGPTFLGGIEIARPTHPGLLGRLAMSAEGGFASQKFAVDQNVVGGDVHTVHAALSLRMALADRSAGAGRLVPYALVGAAWGRPSTRFVLSESSQSTPGASFEQVTHENVPGAIFGAGIGWLTPRAAIRAEARWMSLYTSEGATSTLPLVLMIAVPLHRYGSSNES